MAKELQERMKSIYTVDGNMVYRKSHDNPSIHALYKEYLKEPNSHLAHELLHTSYSYRR